jgi:hypothetical protein
LTTAQVQYLATKFQHYESVFEQPKYSN